MKNKESFYAESLSITTRQHEYVQHDGVGLYRLPAFSGCAVEHGFSTRVGGVSLAPYDTLNLCWTRDYCDDNIYSNYEILCRACGLDFSRMIIVNHQHGSRVVRVDGSSAHYGFPGEPQIPCDGLVTNDPSVILVTSHADCGAVFLFDPATRSVGLCHAGWRGTMARIGAEAVRKMTEEFGAEPGGIIAGIGPCICGACFEVDEALGVAFRKEFAYTPVATDFAGGKARVDLQTAMAVQLLDAGVRPENMYLSDVCTFEDREHLFSYRRDKGKTGSMIAYLRLK